MKLDEIHVGHEVPPLRTVFEPDQVRRYAAAARMPGQRFLSDEAAKREGLPGQIVPGNMSMSLLSRMLLDWLPQARLERLGVTFRGLVRPGRPISCTGFVTERTERPAGFALECDLVLECDGERRVTGTATLAVDPAPARAR